MKVCLDCGSRNTEHATFCARCGAELGKQRHIPTIGNVILDGLGYGIDAILSSGATTTAQTRNQSVERAFRYCPFCGSGTGIRTFQDGTLMIKDNLECLECGARWHLKFGMSGGLKWAELEKPPINGRGTELCWMQIPAEEWQTMGLRKHGEAFTEAARLVHESTSGGKPIVRVEYPAVSTPSAVPTPIHEAVVYCINCGARCRAAANFCPICGTQIHKT